ncbi:MAG: DALR domain-containing protein, partial [Alphaproteobacteria bacterium]
GGIDLVFPHHENELAQGVCAHGGGEYARYWMHNGFLDFSGEKMSKSLGNVVRPQDLLDSGIPGEVLRWALLSAHYRQPLDWTDSLIRQSKETLDGLYQVLRDAAALIVDEGLAENADEEGRLSHFKAALEDDLNTPGAMRELSALGRGLRSAITAGNVAGALDWRANLLFAGNLLGFLQTEPVAWFEGAAGAGMKDKVEALLAERLAARQAKDFATADRIRAELDALGVVVMDSPQGATWRMKD